LQIDSAALRAGGTFAGTMKNFGAGDSLDLPGFAFNTANPNANTATLSGNRLAHGVGNETVESVQELKTGAGIDRAAIGSASGAGGSIGGGGGAMGGTVFVAADGSLIIAG